MNPEVSDGQPRGRQRNADTNARSKVNDGTYDGLLSKLPDQKKSDFLGRFSDQPKAMDPGFAFEALKRSLASSLIRATITGRAKRLTGHEAKCISDKILRRLGVPTLDTDDKADDAKRISAASWLGLSNFLGFDGGSNPMGETKRIGVRRFGLDAEGYDVPLPTSSAEVGVVGNSSTPSNNQPNHRGREEALPPDDFDGPIKEVYDISWTLTLGGVRGEFSIRDLEISDEDQLRERHPHNPSELVQCALIEAAADRVMDDVRANKGDEAIDWKDKYYLMEMHARMMKGHMDRVREYVLDTALAL